MSGGRVNCSEEVARRASGADTPDLPASRGAFDPLDAAAHSTGADNIEPRAPNSASHSGPALIMPTPGKILVS
jgi:hypothetical protein